MTGTSSAMLAPANNANKVRATLCSNASVLCRYQHDALVKQRLRKARQSLVSRNFADENYPCHLFYLTRPLNAEWMAKAWSQELQ